MFLIPCVQTCAMIEKNPRDLEVSSRDDRCSEVHPHSGESTSAPRSMSKHATSNFPLVMALPNGVWLIGLRVLVSIPRSSNDCTASMFPSSAATCKRSFALSFPSSSAPYSAMSNVVDRNLFRVFSFAWYSDMNFTTSAWPFPDAKSATLLLDLSSTSTSAPRRSNSFTTPRCPHHVIKCSRCCPHYALLIRGRSADGRSQNSHSLLLR